jgi:hypothetical protein
MREDRSQRECIGVLNCEEKRCWVAGLGMGKLGDWESVLKRPNGARQLGSLPSDFIVNGRVAYTRDGK